MRVCESMLESVWERVWERDVVGKVAPPRRGWGYPGHHPATAVPTPGITRGHHSISTTYITPDPGAIITF